MLPALRQHACSCIGRAGLQAANTALHLPPRRAKLQADLFTSVKVNWTLWVPAQYINFKYVPVNLQVGGSSAAQPPRSCTGHKCLQCW
jgi:hypothetical protein